jgi:transposase-like protein
MNTEETKPGVAEIKWRRRPQANEREKILAARSASGQAVEEVAGATGGSPWTLYRWRAQARGDRTPPRRRPSERALVAVPAPTATASGEWAAELLTTTGIRVRLAASCAPAWAAQLARDLDRC